MRDVAVIGIGETAFGELWDKSFRDLGIEDQPRPTVRIEGGGACGAIAILQGAMAIGSGLHDIVIVGGAEKMTDVADVRAGEILSATADQEWESVFGATFAGLYAMMARRHMYEHGTT